MDPSAPLKRFYKTVAVENDGNGFRVTLDGRQLKTPAKRSLLVPTQKLADALAQEWDAQEEVINPETMPMMALVSTAIDRIGQLRNGVIEQIAKYAETDLVCYWADNADELTARQSKTWMPFIEWTKETFGVKLIPQTGIMPVKQPEETFNTFHKVIDEYNDWEIAALSSATHCTGSLIIALALLKEHINVQEAFDASQVDETYQIELWGEDWEAKDRREAIMRDLNNVVAYLNHL